MKLLIPSPMFARYSLLMTWMRHWHAGRCAGTRLWLRSVLSVLSVLGWLTWSAAAHAAAPLQLTPGSQTLDAWPAITLQADDTLGRSAQEMLARLEDFKAPANLNGSLGVRDKQAMWLRVPLEASRTPGSPWAI